MNFYRRKCTTCQIEFNGTDNDTKCLAHQPKKPTKQLVLFIVRIDGKTKTWRDRRCPAS